MKSIDLLVPPESLEVKDSAQLPESDNSKLIEAMTTSVTEAIEKTAEGTKNLAETIKTAITDAIAQKAVSTETPAEPETPKED